MSPLHWMAAIALGVMVSFLVMVAIAWLGERKPIRRINAWAAVDAAKRERRLNPLGAAKVWNGEARR